MTTSKTILTRLFTFSTIALLLASCAPRVPFTQAVRDQYKLTEEELKSIQFYTSQDIVLVRGEKEAANKTTEEGKLTIKDGKYVERIVIPKGTPGVVERVIDQNKIAISFEDGTNRYLVFGNPISSDQGTYKLLAGEWVRSRGKLKYGEEIYITNTNADQAILEFKIRKLNNLKKEQRVVKGRKL